MSTDRHEITDLFTRLGRVVDEKRWNDLHTVYTDDVTVHSPQGGRLTGLTEVADFLRQAEVDGELQQHTTTDVLVELAGDQAAASANSLVRIHRDGQPPHRSAAGRLRHTAVRSAAGWRFREARIELAWLQESPGPA